MARGLCYLQLVWMYLGCLAVRRKGLQREEGGWKVNWEGAEKSFSVSGRAGWHLSP